MNALSVDARIIRAHIMVAAILGGMNAAGIGVAVVYGAGVIVIAVQRRVRALPA